MIESTICRIKTREWLIVMACCAVASAIAVAWSWKNGAMLNYGDAVAHLHIARRVFDSHRPGIKQLGSVWLPLPHLLMLPFVQIYSWWATGIAALIPSILAYLAACAGMYRLARHWLPVAPSAMALAFFALNPNLLYLQTTAMTEPLFVCEMVWTAVWLVEWRTSLDTDPPRATRLQFLIMAVLVAAVFTRYDGWIMTLVAWVCMGLALARRGRLRSRAFWLASAVVVAAPLVWFAYNAIGFGDWLYFMRGPYSAKAIEMRTSAPGFPPHPGWHNPWVSLLYFVKAAALDAAAAAWGKVLLAISLGGTVWAWLQTRRRAFNWALLLWFPIAFYAYSISYGSVPIFLPTWWPHSWYNLRYGMEMLPAFALGTGFAAQFVLAKVGKLKPQWMHCTVSVLFAALLANAWQMVRERPQVYVEGTKNKEARLPYEQEIPPVLRALEAERPGGLVLMNTSTFPELIASTGIPLRQTINEGDLEFYHAALAAPAQQVAIVLAFDGDAIDAAVKAHPEGLTTIRRFQSAKEPAGTIYVSQMADARKAPSASTKPARQ